MPTDYREFAKTVKNKYPEYKDVDDLELAKKMVEKYPTYKSQVTFDTVKKKEKSVSASNGVEPTTSSATKGKGTPQSSGSSAYKEIKEYTGFPGREENKYRVVDNNWQRKKPNESWNTVRDANAIIGLNKQFKKTITPNEGFEGISSKLIDNSEETVVPYLQKNYGNLGFKFEQTGTGDRVRVITEDGKNSEVFALDNWTDAGDSGEALRMKAWLSGNVKTLDREKADVIDQEIKNIKNVKPSKSVDLKADAFSGMKATLTSDVLLDVTDQMALKEKQSEAIEYNKNKMNKLVGELAEAKKTTIKTDDEFVRAKIASVYDNKDELAKQNRYISDNLNDIARTQKDVTRRKTEYETDLDQWNKDLEDAGGVETPDLEQRRLDIQGQAEMLDKEMSDIEFNVSENKKNTSKLEKMAGEVMLQRASQGSTGGTIVNSFIKAATNIGKFAGMEESSQKELVKALGSDLSTEEYRKSEDRSTFEQVLFSVAESLGAASTAAVGGGAMAATSFFAQSYYGMKDEINSNEKFKDVPEEEKQLLAVTYGLTIGWLEKFGIDKVISKTPIGKKLTNSILTSVIKGLPKGAPAELIEQAVNSKMKYLIAKGAVNITAGTGVEFSVGFTQSLAESGIKELYNVAKEQELFKQPESILGTAVESGWMEAMGGFVMQAPIQAIDVMSKGLSSKNLITAEVLEKAVTDSELRAIMVTNIKDQIVQKQITREEGQQQIQAVNDAASVFSKIPDNVSDIGRAKSFDLLIERSKIEKEIEGKDASLVDVQNSRITEINNELKAISNATKENKQPIEEGAVEGSISEYPRAGEGQQEEGISEGSQRQATQPGTDRGDSTIPSEVQQEKIVVDKPTITTNTATEVDRVKSLATDAEDGATLNLDGSKYEGVGLVVPVDSVNTTMEELTPEMIADFVEERQDMIGDAGVVKAGIYKFPNSNQVSIDLSVVVPETSREQAIEFGKLSDQESLYDLGSGENVKTGGTGKNPMKFTPEQHREIATALKEGRVPNVFGPTVEQEVELQPSQSQTNEVTNDNSEDTINRIAIETKDDRKINVAKAARSVLKSLPKVKIFLHNTTDEYREAIAGKEGKVKEQIDTEESDSPTSGAYIDNEIHIDLSKANSATVFHEAFHHAFSVLGFKTGSARAMAQGLKKIVSDRALIDKITKFEQQYEGETDPAMAEEFLAELAAIITENKQILTPNNVERIKQLINSIAKKLGIPAIFKATDGRKEVLDFMNNVSKGMRTGIEIKTKEISADTADLSRQKRKIGAFDVQYFEDSEQFQKLVDEGLVENNFDLGTIAGKVVAIHQPDNMFVGTIKHKGEEIFTGNGGVFYVTNTGNVWASGTESKAKILANLINKSLSESSDGIGRLVLVRGADSKMISSTEGVKAAMSIVELMVDNGLISRSDFRSSLIRAGKDFGINFSGKDSATDIHKDIKNKFMDVKNSTFQRRGDFFDKVITDLSTTSSSVKENIDGIRKMLGSKRKISFSKDGVRDSIGEILTERLLSGLPNSHVYAIIEVTEPVTSRENKGHDSYPWILESKSKPKLKLLSDRKHAVKDGIFEMIDGSTVSGPKLGLSNTGMGIAKIAGTNISSRKKRMTEPVAGNKLFNESLKDASKIAEDYSKKSGIEYIEPEKISKLDESNSKDIADEYDKMKNDPTDPEVKAAYDSMIKETLDQYEEITKNGYVVEVNNNEPYSSSEDMIKDLRDNKRMKIFSSESGFGDEAITEAQRSENPLLQKTKYSDSNGVPLLANDIFRFVHDFFGHAKFGNGFGPIGEENAWRVHSAMYSDLARRAMTSETRGQNSWVNFSGANDAVFKLRDKARELRKQGKIDEANELVGKVYDDMLFADQKVGLMPEWVSETGGRKKRIEEKPEKKSTTQKEIEKQLKRPVTKKTVNEYTALKDQLRLEAKAARAASMDLKQKQRSLIEVVKSMAKTGKITVDQATVIMKKIGNLNLDNPTMVSRFIDYAGKVFERADYQQRLSTANGIKKKIKKSLKKDRQAETIAMAKEFSKIDPSTISDIDAYIDMANTVYESMIPSGTRGMSESLALSETKGINIVIRESANIDQVSKYTEGALLEQEEYLKNELKNMYKDLVDQGIIDDSMSLSEIKELINGLNDPTAEMPTKEKERYIKDYIKGVIDTYAGIINHIIEKGEDPITGESIELDGKEKLLMSKLLDVDIDLMNVKSAFKIVDLLNNFVTNKVTSSVEGIVAEHDGIKNADRIAKSGFVARSLKAIGGKLNVTDSISVGRVWAEQISTITTLSDTLFGGVKSATSILKNLGFSAFSSGVAYANTKWNGVTESYSNQFKKSKPNGEAFNTAKNIYERGLYAFVARTVQGGSVEQKAELKRKIGLIEQSIKVLREGTDTQKQTAEIYQELYDKLGLSDADVNITDIESRVDAENVKAVNWWIDQWSEHYSDLSDVSLSVYNTMLGKDINYTTDSFGTVKDEAKDLDDILEQTGGAFAGSVDHVYNKKTGVLMESNRTSSMNTNRYVSLDFDTNNAKALKSALIDINTAAATRQIAGFLGSDAYKKIIPTAEDRDLFSKRIKSYVVRSRNKMSVPSDQLAAVERLSRVLSTLGASKALGSVFQAVKQTVPLMISTVVNAGSNFNPIATMTNPAANRFISRSKRDIANRGAESQTDIENANSILEKASTSKLSDAMGVIESLNKFWLTTFLSKPDIWIARSAFLAYYKQDLKRQGIEVTDWDAHEVNDDAADYAQHMVDRQQNISDINQAGEFMATEDPWKKITKNLLMPFAGFSLNQKSRMYSDIVTAASKTTSKEDRIIAIRSLSGLGVEMAAYHGIGFAIRAYLLMAIADAITGDEPSDEDREKVLDNQVSYMTESVIRDVLSPLPATDYAVIWGMNKLMQEYQDKFPNTDGAKLALDARNESLTLRGKDELTKEEAKKFTDNWIEENKFNLLNKETASLGTYSIASQKSKEFMELYNMAINGEYEQEFAGKITVKKILPSDREAAKNMIPYMAAHMIGLLPAETSSISRYVMKNVKKKGLTEAKYEKINDVKKELGTSKLSLYQEFLSKGDKKLEGVMDEINWIEENGGLKSNNQQKEYIKLMETKREVTYDDLKRIQKM